MAFTEKKSKTDKRKKGRLLKDESVDTVPKRIDPRPSVLCAGISSLSRFERVIISVRNNRSHPFAFKPLIGRDYPANFSSRTKAVQVFFEFQFLSGYVRDGNCYKVLGSREGREMSTSLLRGDPEQRTDRVEFIKDARASWSLGE